MTAEDRDPDANYWKDRDACFCAAMRICIAAGLENPPAMHVVVDNSQAAPGARVVHTYSEPRSYGGSPAAWCADVGHDYYSNRERP